MFYTLEKTAEMLGLSTGDVTRLRESNKLRGFRDGQTWKFRKEDVDKYLQDMIRERSRANDLLAGEQDETNPTMLADSASFDSLLDGYSFNDTADEPVADPVVNGVDELITDSVDSVDDLVVDALVTDGADSTDSLIAEMVGSNIPGSDNAEDDLSDDANDVPTSATDSPTISTTDAPTISDAPTDASLLTDRTEDDLSGDSKDLSSSEFDAPTISATGSPTISETDAPTISDAPTDASLLTDRTEDDLSGDSKDLSSSESDAPTLYDDVQGASGVASGVVDSLTTDDDLIDSNGDAPALGAQSETSGENDEPMDESKDAPALVAQSEASSENDELMDESNDAPAVVAQSEASSEDDDLMIVADEDSSVAPSSPDAMSLDALIAEPDVSAVAPDTVENLIASTDSVLVDDVDEDEARSSSVDLSSISDDDVLSTASDSGLALLGGSSDDIVLGGSGSGSGSALSLDSSDSGISLLGGGSDSGFDLSGGADDQGIFELQEEGQDGAYNLVEETPDVLNLEPEADPDAPTELGSDESVFELIDETSVTTGDDTSSSDVDSASSLIETEDSSLYSTDEPTDNGPMTSDDALFTTDDEEPDPFGPFAGAAATADTTAGFASNPFETDDTQPDDGGNPFDGMSDGFGGDAFGGFDGSDPNAAASGIDANPFGDDESPFVEGVSADDLPGQGLGVARAKVNSSDIRGMDFLLLAPCLIFLILATIGAVELCRTIWSYQEGTGAIAGPILESIAKMVKLI